MITFAFDHLIAEAGVEEFIVNTHHCAEAFGPAFPGANYRGSAPALSPRAGAAGLGWRHPQHRRLLGPQPETLLVYNGDILTDLPLGPLLEHHRASGNEVTLALRLEGRAETRRLGPGERGLLDIRNRLGTGAPDAYAFASVYLIEPAFLARIPGGRSRRSSRSFWT